MTTASPARSGAQAHGGAGETEREARDRIAPRAGTLRGRVLAAVVASADGLTALEAWRLLVGDSGLGLYSIAPRLSELESDGYVHVTGSRREREDAPRRQVYAATRDGQAWAQVNQ